MATGVFAIEIPDSVVQSAVGALLAIPADRYAVVRAQAVNGETFMINGTVVMSSEDKDIARKTEATNGNQSYTVPAGKEFEGWWHVIAGGGGATSTITPLDGSGTFTEVSTNLDVRNLRLGPGHILTSTGGTGPTRQIAGILKGREASGFSQVFRVPPGATIQGGKYHAELYKIPGSAT